MTISSAQYATYVDNIRSGITTELKGQTNQLVIAILYKVLEELGLSDGFYTGSEYHL